MKDDDCNCLEGEYGDDINHADFCPVTFKAKIAELEGQLSAYDLLNHGYENGRNSDPESEEVCSIYYVTGGVNDREYKEVATGRSVLEALLKIQPPEGGE